MAQMDISSRSQMNCIIVNKNKTSYNNTDNKVASCPFTGTLYFFLTLSKGFLKGTPRKQFVSPRMTPHSLPLSSHPSRCPQSLLLHSWAIALQTHSCSVSIPGVSFSGNNKTQTKITNLGQCDRLVSRDTLTVTDLHLFLFSDKAEERFS